MDAKKNQGQPPMSKSLPDRIKFDFIRYANCWEDADVLCTALQPRPGKRILSIASGGDNSLALAAEGADVLAADFNPTELACVELKCAAIKLLEYEEVLGFLGLRPMAQRLAYYVKIKKQLSEFALAFWDQNQRLINKGLVHAGKFEKFFNLFRKRILPFIHSSKRVRQLLLKKGLAERIHFYNKYWNNFSWNLLFRIFLVVFPSVVLGVTRNFFVMSKVQLLTAF
jgi:S-adenosylmethionine-diacylglycerol 3-amino-3-carboxypropyl transferase